MNFHLDVIIEIIAPLTCRLTSMSLPVPVRAVAVRYQSRPYFVLSGHPGLASYLTFWSFQVVPRHPQLICKRRSVSSVTLQHGNGACRSQLSSSAYSMHTACSRVFHFLPLLVPLLLFLVFAWGGGGGLGKGKVFGEGRLKTGIDQCRMTV